LSDGLCLDPLGERTTLPRPHIAGLRGLLLKGGERRKTKEKEGNGREEKRRKDDQLRL